ncbi:symbiosis regulated acidic polypeptide SRAP32-2 [Pisolithus marmoratus]|nr:symbiosis regulated acidic polypeptide SRAP32-2 [Pisolithus marmoratus]
MNDIVDIVDIAMNNIVDIDLLGTGDPGCIPALEDPLTGRRKLRIKPFGRSSGPEAAIIGGTVSSVLGNLTEQNRRDVANSLEYATHVAHQKTREDEGYERFWEEYMDCLFRIGWDKTRNEWSNLSLVDTTSDIQTFCDYVTDNIRKDPLYTQEEKDLIIQGLEIIRSQTSKQEFFRRFTVRKSRGTLGICTASVENDVLKLRFSAFMFSCDADVEDFIVTSIAYITFDAKKGIVGARADQCTIDRLRAQIEEELEQASGDYINEFDI